MLSILMLLSTICQTKNKSHYSKFAHSSSYQFISEHFGKNGIILLQIVAKWWCIKLCAFFLTHSVHYASYATSCTSSTCKAMEQPSHYPLPVLVPARYATEYQATSGSGFQSVTSPYRILHGSLLDHLLDYTYTLVYIPANFHRLYSRGQLLFVCLVSVD